MTSSIHITQTQNPETQTVTKGQIAALKSAIRAAAEANPAGVDDKGRRCAELSIALCGELGIEKLAELPASCFPLAMKTLSGWAVPTRQQGASEAVLRAGKERLEEAVADILKARRIVAGYRHEAERALLAPLKVALDLNGKGNLEAVAQDGLGYMVAMPLLDIEHELDRIQSTLQVLGARLPAVGRALDECGAVPTDAGAD